MNKQGNWKQTFTGKQFWPFAPTPKDICLLDIVWPLSQKVRFTGHCNRFYSVLEHSLLVSKFCKKYPLEGLFHDTAEAYLPDIDSPLKPSVYIELPSTTRLKGEISFKDFEDRILQVIFHKYNLIWPLPDEVCKIDRAILFDEQQELMPDPPEEWGQTEGPSLGLSPLTRKSPYEAAFEFLRICEREGIRD